MGARKNVNVTGANKNTAALSAGADVGFTHFRIVASDDTTAKTIWLPITGAPKTVSANGSLNVVDAGIYMTLGTQNGAGTDKFSQAVQKAMLDAGFATGATTDLIQWSSDGSTKSSRMASTAVDVWDAAIDWT